MYRVVTEISKLGIVEAPPADWNDVKRLAWTVIGPAAWAHKELIQKILIVQNPPEPRRGEIPFVQALARSLPPFHGPFASYIDQER
ncbi:hypothetical protein POL68_20655 [Stigmatella sp. ncwal1]|uniref:Uncharacterized protein n=1 Tax=Stigmatella ashevillensis TaxID=2995309 RepID=A0ABT5DEY7_9BACT|nr:hypothetical protein [Stigmatella ashevillena]MDC0710896.1 hypothetical protein [Stigmatella ashevillena]